MIDLFLKEICNQHDKLTTKFSRKGNDGKHSFKTRLEATGRTV